MSTRIRRTFYFHFIDCGKGMQFLGIGYVLVGRAKQWTAIKRLKYYYYCCCVCTAAETHMSLSRT